MANPTLEELIEEFRLVVEPLMGGTTGLSDIPENISDPFVQLVVHALGGLENLYNNLDTFTTGFDVSTATCEQLELIAALIGETRNTTGQTSVVEIIIVGSNGLTIAAGTTFIDNLGVEWELAGNVIIKDGIGIGLAQSPIGPFVTTLNTMSLVTPIDGVTNATNGVRVRNGFTTETCEQFRTRLMTNSIEVLETEELVLDKLTEVADSAKFINDAPECLGGATQSAFVVRGGDDQDIADVISTYAPLNYTALSGNAQAAVNTCEIVRFIRPCALGLELRYWGDEAIADAEFIAAMCNQDKITVATFVNAIDCLNHVEFRVIPSRPDTLVCANEPTEGEDCTGSNISLIVDEVTDCHCLSTDCPSEDYIKCFDVKSWEFPVFISATYVGTTC